MASTTAAARPIGQPLLDRLRPDLITVLCTVLLAIVGFVVLYPIVLLAVNSFRVGDFGRATAWGLGNWQAAFSQPKILGALENTFTLALTRQAIATLIGVSLAWILARTNLPGRHWLELCFWFALLLPNLPILMGWILLLDGHYGILINAAPLLGIIRSLQSFEIELVLGGSAGIDVYSTLIYRQVLQSPPEYGKATALSMVILLALVPFILMQQWIVGRKNYTTVSGKYTNRLYDLGALKWPLFGLVVASLAAIVALPTLFMFLGTFMKVFGVFTLPEPWTTQNWQRVLSDRTLSRALVNTLLIGLGATVFSVALFTVIAYISVRTRFIGRRVLDFVTWLPSTVPGIVTSLGLLWLFIGTPMFRPLYGTLWILIIALGLAGMTLGVQLIKASLLQLGQELEEASWANGAGWVYTLRKVLLPLIAPTIAVVALQSFAAAASAVSLVALLGSANNKPLSLLQLEYLDTGLFEAASVIGVIIFFLTVGAAVLARVISLHAGLGRFER